MHVWTRLKKEADGKTGIGVYADGMVEHDGHVGQLLRKLDELGLADNTIVMYSTDNGAETVTWPDGGTTPFHGEKGTNWEGGQRVPLLVRWPGVLRPGSEINDMIAHNDWLPTLLAAAGDPDVKARLAQGHQANGKTWKVRLDGYNFLPYFRGEARKGPREEYLYFGQGGEFNAIRWNDWKIHFASYEGNIALGTRRATNWPIIVNLRADPYEKAPHESGLYIRWYADNLWLFVPVQGKVKEFFADFDQFPFQMGSTLTASGIGYQTLRLRQTLDRLQQLETLSPPRN
jgi:arylsulfatase